MKIRDVITEDNIELGDSFDIELGNMVIETGVVGFMPDGVIVEADDKTLALLGLGGALLESVAVNEVTLGDYSKKAQMDRALSQMSMAFGNDQSPERKAKLQHKMARRDVGLDRARVRGQRAQAAADAKRRAEYEQSMRDKYAGVDIDAEIAKLQPAMRNAYDDYQYGASNTWSAGKDEYNRLRAQVQELERAKKILQQDLSEGFGSNYAEQLAQEVFDHNPNIKDENQVLNLGYNISKSDLGSRAQGIFRDEDFPSDFVSAYFYLQKQGLAEGSGNIGRQIKALYKKIYDQGDDSIDYMYHESPVFAQIWDEYEGDLDSIIAEVDPSELQVIANELEAYLQGPGLDEAKYQGREVTLGKPMAGDVKKSKVYVRGPKGNVVKVNFGDKKMRIKKSNPKRRKSFRARHNCANPGPRWKARYWSCRAW